MWEALGPGLLGLCLKMALFQPIRDSLHRNNKIERFLALIWLFLRFGHGSKTFLGSTNTDKQLSFSRFCSISSPSYLSGWVGDWIIMII